MTVLLTTHDLDEAERVADRVVIVDRGRLVAEGTVDELTRTPGADELRFPAPARPRRWTRWPPTSAAPR